MRISRLMILLTLLAMISALLTACGPTRGGRGGSSSSDDDDSTSDDDDADDDDSNDDDDDAVEDDDDAASSDVSGVYIWEYEFTASGLELGFYDCEVVRDIDHGGSAGPSGCSDCDETWEVDLDVDTAASSCDPAWFPNGLESFTGIGLGVGGGGYWEHDGEVWNERIPSGSQSGSSFSGASDWEELGDIDGDGTNDYLFRLLVDLDF